MALFYTAVAMGVSSLTTRRAVAAVATVLVLLVPQIAVGVAVESSGAPVELTLLTPGVATEYAFRVFGEARGVASRIRPSPTSRQAWSSPASQAGSCSGSVSPC